MSAITAQTRVFTILGNPVEHSLSPVIQNAAFQEAGVDGVYVAPIVPLIRQISRGHSSVRKSAWVVPIRRSVVQVHLAPLTAAEILEDGLQMY